MDNPRPEKVAVVDEVRSRLSGSSGAILTEYRGLTVSELAELRRTLERAGGDYKVYKNTLVKLATAGTDHEELHSLLVGPTAIAFVNGEISAPRRCGTTRGPTPTWWSKVACPERASSRPPSFRPSPTFLLAMCFLPAWPVRSPPPSSRWQGSCRRFLGTLLTGCRRSSRRGRPRPALPKTQHPKMHRQTQHPKVHRQTQHPKVLPKTQHPKVLRQLPSRRLHRKRPTRPRPQRLHRK
jgi:hypothetical protein